MSYPDNADLQEVNERVNKMPYESDLSKYGVLEKWERITDMASGDCEDAALGKLNELLKLGWPISMLRIATCFVETPPPNGHAVLIVDGDTVLDNRQPFPCSLRDLEIKGYRPDKIQKYGGSRTWVKWAWA